MFEEESCLNQNWMDVLTSCPSYVYTPNVKHCVIVEKVLIE